MEVILFPSAVFYWRQGSSISVLENRIEQNYKGNLTGKDPKTAGNVSFTSKEYQKQKGTPCMPPNLNANQ